MRKLLALIAMGLATLFVAPATQAADMPYYPEVEIPDVDYGLEGSFYLRGSVGGNLMWAREFLYNCACAPNTFDVEKFGYGYSFGAGIGYEFGDGLRADLTVDYIANDGMYGALQTPPDNITFGLRSTVALANVYYDFGFGDGFGAAQGGFGAYVGAGLGFAHYTVSDIAPPPGNAPSGSGITGAGALMAGVSYDMGAAVADFGYRGIYMPIITNSSVAQPGTLISHDNFLHELRGTVRYRFN
ncbi:MAG: hypothetical protein EOP19_05995 [Hyphomicrobiales bacterium]|nr:MAG: hypothetical protein EOP19_05995 [Hyphomicrobiales bacterium]